MARFIVHATKTITQKISFAIDATDLDDAHVVAEEEIFSYPIDLLGKNISVEMEIVPDLE